MIANSPELLARGSVLAPRAFENYSNMIEARANFKSTLAK
jgi:hypothetical protein